MAHKGKTFHIFAFTWVRVSIRGEDEEEEKGSRQTLAKKSVEIKSRLIKLISPLLSLIDFARPLPSVVRPFVGGRKRRKRGVSCVTEQSAANLGSQSQWVGRPAAKLNGKGEGGRVNMG